MYIHLKDISVSTSHCEVGDIYVVYFINSICMCLSIFDIKPIQEMSESLKRVKVYMLNSQRQWEDKGTGYVSTPYVKQFKGISLTVMSETDGSQLLQVKIHPHVAYQKQQDTLIVWSEDKNLDLALSFQEKPNCEEIWKIICQFQGKDSSVDITQDIVEESEDDKFSFLSEPFPDIDLPLCELCSLKEINEIISANMHPPIRREKLAAIIENDSYIEKLLSLFHECEDLEYTEGLNYLYEIFSNIFLLNKNNLFEEMFQDSNILDVIGCLEYDPSSPTPKKYRHNLKELANYRNVVPITNPLLLNKIHQTYRIQYLQDIVLPIPPITENNMFSALSGILILNKMDIVSSIQEDDSILSQLFTMLNDETADDLKRRELILFLRELFIFAQCLQNPDRESLCKKLTSLGIFQTFEMNLNTNDTRSKSALVDILNCFVEFSPVTVREYITRKISGNSDNTFMNVVISQIIHDPDEELGSGSQILCILKTLLDPENMLLSSNQMEKSDFLRYFYNNHANFLFAPLLKCSQNEPPGKTDYRTHQLLGLLVDFLAYCVDNHTYHIQNYIIDNDLVKKTLILMKSEHVFVALGALKCMRKIIGQVDDTYNKYIIKENLIAPIVESFLRNRKNNILSSAILEMFQFINMEGTRQICFYIVDNFWSRLKSVEHTNIFKILKNRFDMYKEGKKSKDDCNDKTSSHDCSHRYRRDERDLEEEEEKWFDEDDENEDKSTAGEANCVNQVSVSPSESVLSCVKSKTAVNVTENMSSDNKDTRISISPSNCKSDSVTECRRLSCKRALVDYEGDSDEEDDVMPSSTKRTKMA